MLEPVIRISQLSLACTSSPAASRFTAHPTPSPSTSTFLIPDLPFVGQVIPALLSDPRLSGSEFEEQIRSLSLPKAVADMAKSRAAAGKGLIVESPARSSEKAKNADNVTVDLLPPDEFDKTLLPPPISPVPNLHFDLPRCEVGFVLVPECSGDFPSLLDALPRLDDILK